MICPVCGGDASGDGYKTVIACNRVWFGTGEQPEPDAAPFWCDIDHPWVNLDA